MFGIEDEKIVECAEEFFENMLSCMNCAEDELKYFDKIKKEYSDNKELIINSFIIGASCSSAAADGHFLPHEEAEETNGAYSFMLFLKSIKIFNELVKSQKELKNEK